MVLTRKCCVFLSTVMAKFSYSIHGQVLYCC